MAPSSYAVLVILETDAEMVVTITTTTRCHWLRATMVSAPKEEHCPKRMIVQRLTPLAVLG